METVIKSLSVLTSKPWKSNMDNTSYKQVKRTYQDGFSFNFPFALSGFNDFKSKEYSNLYLTTNLQASWFLELDESISSAPKLLTYIQSGGVYLARPDIIGSRLDNYPVKFNDALSDATYFDISFYDGNLCALSFTAIGKTFYLAYVDNVLKFVWDFSLPSSFNDSDPHVFKCVYNNKQQLYLIKEIDSINQFVVRQDNSLIFKEITADNKTLITNSYFNVSRDKGYELQRVPDTSFITYLNNSNDINFNKSVFNLKNNFLIHSPYSSHFKDVIVLKNQLTTNDTFTNGQNLLSSGYDIAVDKFRNYSNITTPIDSENSSEINLNYVFYNKPYIIRRGITEFTTPSSMYPFTNLNINDTRFVDCGAYAFDTPSYSDKIFQLNRNIYSEDGKTYLCTWLSGSNDNKIWVDRYYYPDLISKQSALLQKGVFRATYEQALEKLITTNPLLSTVISKTPIFDKRSDLSFKPNEVYRYHRFDNSVIFDTISTVNTTACGVNTTPYDYRSLINDSGQITLSFYFNGNDPDWVVESLRNNIDSGIRITKTSDNVRFEFKIFDNSSNETQIFTVTTAYKKYKLNFICFSYDALTGKGFFFFNNEKILDIRTPIGQFSNKTILYGKIYYNDQDILENDSITSNIFISDQKIEENLAFILPFIQNKQTVDDITITLPCGMRNSMDDITYIHLICNTNANKSNYINVSVDNIGISNESILKELKTSLLEKIQTQIPSTTNINNIKFTNYI
jgi:hypothetical protein